jgi:spore germination protein
MFTSFSLVSCIPHEEIEDLGIITARGIDVVEDDLLDATLVIFQFDVQSSSITKTVSGKGKTLKGAMNNADLESIFTLSPGKIEIELYGKETAKKGILPYLDTLQRDARVSNTMYLAISDTTAKEILTMPEENISMNIGQFLRGVIENNATDHNFPKITLQDFLRVYFDIGIDNALPIFELKDDNIPKVTKIALFKGDQLAGELSIQEATFLNLITNTVREKLLELSLPGEPFEKYLEKREHRSKDEELHITLTIEKGKSKTTLTDKEGLTFETEVNIDLRLTEQSTGVLFDSSQVTQLLEDEIKKKMTADFESLLAKTQEFATDPFGYGIIYRINQKNGKLTRDEWREKYPEIKVKFKVNPRVFRHGTTE